MTQNETKRLVDDMMRVVTKKAKAVFVSRLEELVHENYGTRDGAVLDRIAVTDAKAADVEWLQDHLSEAAEEEVARLERFVVGVIAERDHFKAMLRERAEELLAAREEIERLRALYVEARVDGFRDGRKVGAEAMREAAAQLVIREVDSWMHSSLSDEIRHLQIPEDRP